MDAGRTVNYATIPMQWVGPLQILLEDNEESVEVPLATYETPLFPSVRRGARVTARSGGIRLTVLRETMTRSILVTADSAAQAWSVVRQLKEQDIAEQVAATSRFARLKEIQHEIIGNQLYLRLCIHSGDASGHNMATQAAERVQAWLLKTFPELRYGSISGNFCIDKKVSAVNSLLGRGKHVIAEVEIPTRLCRRYLRTTPEAMEKLNIGKNLLGSIAAGSLRSANAHYANMLLAFYLATGQDAANIVEGSQGITHVEAREDSLYFSCTLPNIIVGTVGNGKDLPFVQENLERLGCTAENPPGTNARRLASLAAATVLCGELSLMAALCNPGELMQSHRKLERGGQPG